MAAIFVASSSSDPSYVPPVFSDELLHLGIYASLGAALLHAFADGRAERITRRRVVAAIGASLLYGMSDEFHQSFVPGRTPDVMDLLMDVIGASAGAAVYGLAMKKL
jgi:VanZ family protein